MFASLKVIKNPLVHSYMTMIRDKRTSFKDFRDYVDKLAVMLAYECARELNIRKKSIKTPLGKFQGCAANGEIILLPILRAGLGLVHGFNYIFPYARIAHMGLYRDEEDLKPVKYYFKFPRLKHFNNTSVFILDPMLATGGSINCTIAELHRLGIRKIVIASLLCAPEGIKEIYSKYKHIPIYTCSLDKGLNKRGFIVPGLGDAGDRMFGT